MSFGGPPPPHEPSGTPPPQPVYGQAPPPLHDVSRKGAAFAADPGAGFASALDRPIVHARPAPAAPAAAPAVPVAVRPSRSGMAVSIWVFGVLALLLIALAAYFVFALGTGASVVGLILALIPLTIVLLGVRMIDRWEPEPRSLVVFAVAWGAVAATGITLLVDLLLTLSVGSRNAFFSTVIQAPLVEELAKGLGVFLVFLIGRRAFDGPVDGVVYGALVGAGFAFTENIQYFGTSLIEGGALQLGFTFVLRGLLSPFAHTMFTIVTGFAIGLAVRRNASVASALGAGALGAIGAVALHAYWNGSSLLGDFWPLYLTTQVPLFIGFIVVVILLRREEARLTQQRLGEYAAAGWFTPQEVVMLATPAGRRAGLQWAASLRTDRRPLMRSFIKEATTLAAVRQRALTGRDPVAAADEQALLMSTRQTRAQLLAP